MSVATGNVGGHKPGSNYIRPIEGVYEGVPLKGIIYWNSHAFTLTTQATEVHAWLNMRIHVRAALHADAGPRHGARPGRRASSVHRGESLGQVGRASGLGDVLAHDAHARAGQQLHGHESER